MWDGGEEGNIYLNQPVALFPLKQKPKSSSNSVNTILFKKQKTKNQKQKKPKKLNSKETIKKNTNFKNLSWAISKLKLFLSSAQEVQEMN